MILTDSLLLDYKRCQRRAFLNLYGNSDERSSERDFLLKLRQESQKHITSVLTEFYPDHQQPQSPRKDWEKRVAETKTLMEQGVDCIYDGFLAHALREPTQEREGLILLGHPHLLIKQSGNSVWGDWFYTPVSIQLGRRPKPEYKILAALYAQLLAVWQERFPPYAEIILRRQNRYRVDLVEWLPRLHSTITECLQTLVQRQEPEVFISRQRCNLCHWYDHCYAIAQSQSHLSLVPGVTPSRYESLQEMGVVTVNSLAEACPITMAEMFGNAIASQLQTQAIAIMENRAIAKANLPKKSLPNANFEIYFDIEAEPERNLDYLLGVILINRETKEETFSGFIAEEPEEEGKIWQEFLTLMQAYPTAPIFHFAEYEVETIKRLAQLYNTPKKERDQLLNRCFDLHHYVVNAVTFPVENYSLKTLANWLGFQWRDSNASGDQSVWWYDQWLETRDRNFLDLVIRYNEDDCRATWILKDWLVNFFNKNKS
jgi:predicted RecB family nuclease